MNKSYSPTAPPQKNETNNNFKKLCEGVEIERGRGGK